MTVVFQLRDDYGFAAGHTAHTARVPAADRALATAK